MTHFKLLTAGLFVTAFTTGSFAADDHASSGEKVPPQASAFQPVASGKDESSKTIHFTMADPTQDGEPITAEIQIDPKAVNDIPTLREELKKQQEEAARKVSFLRIQMGLPADTPDDNVMALFAFSGSEAQKELEKQYREKSACTAALCKQSFKQTFSWSPHGFASQTVLFGVAQGAVMYLICQKEYAFNPACMEQLIQGVKDPIGQLAFSSFIVANGFTTSLMNRKYGGVPNPQNRVWWDKRPNPSTMRMAIPYVGMSAGMLASNLSAELLNLMLVCGKTLLAQNHPPTALPVFTQGAGQSNKKTDKEEDPCNMAQKEFFNFDNKVEQYIPMLASMASTTWLLVKVGKNVQRAKWLTSAALTSEFGQKVQGTKIMKYVAKKAAPLIAKISFRLAAHVTPAGWILDGMTVAGAAANVLQNAGFIALDHTFMPAFNATWGQLWRASRVDNAEEKLKRYMIGNQQNDWDIEKNYKNNKSVSIRNPERTLNMPPVLEEFSTQMDAWRMINHSKVFMGIQTWADITNNLIREINAAETFYKYYTDRVFDYFKFKEKSQTPEGIEGDEKIKASYVAFRTYPLYGVKPTGHAECAEGVDPDACVTELELYLTYPDDMEKFQLRTMKDVMARFDEKVLNTLKPGQLKPEVDKVIRALAVELKSNDVNRIGKALYNMNMMMVTNSLNDKTALVIFAMLRQALGDPRPTWEQGILLPGLYEASMAETKVYQGLEDKSKLGYKFSSHIDYLLYQMMCGPDAKKSDSVFSETFGFKPTFNPPKITNFENVEVEWPKNWVDRQNALGIQVLPRTFLCVPGVSVPFALLFKSKIIEFRQKTGIPFMEFLGKHIRPDITGDWTNTNRNSTSNFQVWWNSTIKEVLFKLFARMDKEFQQLLAEMTISLNNERLSDGFFNGFMKKHFGFETEIDPKGEFKLTKAGRSLYKSHIQEINVYLSILGDLENQLDPKTYATKKSKIDPDKSLLEQMAVPPFARSPLQAFLIKDLAKVAYAVSSIRLVNNKATLAVPMKSFNESYDSMVTQLAVYKDALGKLNLNKYQKEIAEKAYDHLNKSALQLGVYVFNTQLTNFSASSEYKAYLQNSSRVMETNKPSNKIKQGNSPYAH